MQLYVLESFLARMSATPYGDRLVLKGGVLLAVFGERRPTRDIDLQAQSIGNEPTTVRAVITDIAATSLDDGVFFDTQTAIAEVIRQEDQYQAVRVSMTASLATARPSFHVDISVGDPISPEPQIVQLPRILCGTIAVRGYPLAMVYAEKIVTAIIKGTANTRWRDFADIYALARRHAIDGAAWARQSARWHATAARGLRRSATPWMGTALSASSAGKHGDASSVWKSACPASSLRWWLPSWPSPTPQSRACLTATRGTRPQPNGDSCP
jgi:hypothetical protein